MKTHLTLLLCVASLSGLKAQETASVAPKTKLQAFEAQSGSVIIKGYSEIGKVNGTGSVSVDSREIVNAKTGQRLFGILIEVTESGSVARRSRSYIDQDEIEALLAGLDYVSKITGDATKLKSFEASYTTKGDFEITVFNNTNNKLSAAVSSGRIGRAAAFISMERLAELRNLIVQAKQQLDAIK